MDFVAKVLESLLGCQDVFAFVSQGWTAICHKGFQFFQVDGWMKSLQVNVRVNPDVVNGVAERAEVDGFRQFKAGSGRQGVETLDGPFPVGGLADDDAAATILESGGKESLRGDEVEGEEAQSLGEPDGPGPGSDPGLGSEWKSAGLPAVHDLPGGVNGGIFIHAMLEDIPFDEIKGLSFEEWSFDESVRERALKIAKRYGIEEVYLDAALQMSYAALRTPLSAKSLEEQDAFSMPGGIASGSHYRTEMEFAYPIPENFHPLLAERDNNTEAFVTEAETGGLSYRALRGYIQGFIDLVFEHEGKIYLLDWKSDRMPSYERGTLNSHIENNYKLQSRVYILALLRFLNIYSREDYESQFGGVLYLFTRGLAADVEPGLDNDHASDSDLALDGGRAGDTPGVWFSLPPWSEVCRWEQDMVGHNEWGGPVIETGKPGGGIG